MVSRQVRVGSTVTRCASARCSSAFDHALATLRTTCTTWSRSVSPARSTRRAAATALPLQRPHTSPSGTQAGNRQRRDAIDAVGPGGLCSPATVPGLGADPARSSVGDDHAALPAGLAGTGDAHLSGGAAKRSISTAARATRTGSVPAEWTDYRVPRRCASTVPPSSTSVQSTVTRPVSEMVMRAS